MMYNPQLETFICMVESGSFSRAAQKLFISPPAVIKQINSLEAKYIINYCNDSIKRVNATMQISEDVIRVGISPLTPPQIFVKLWPKIQQLYPDMKFQRIPFDNTLENARKILANLGQNIDVVAGMFDDYLLKLRRCNGIKISMEPFCVAVSIHHRFAKKDKISLKDMEGGTLMLMQKGWSSYGDRLRDDITENYPEIHIADFDLYNVEVFNRCENNNELLLAVKSWEGVHPLTKIIPVDWQYGIPFGLLYSKEPSLKVKKLLKAVDKVK